MSTNTKSKSWIWRQRIGFGSADFACNLIWQTISLYLLFFYTDVMQLPAAAISFLFLGIRCIDGLTDMIMGIIIDKTKTRWGKSRPYVLFGAPLFALAAFLAFTVPDISTNGKVAYAYVTYFFLSLMYTVVNVPLSSILPALTDDMEERTKLATSRTFFSLLGSTVVSYFALRWVAALGNGSQQKGFQIVMGIFGVIACAVLIFAFFNTREINPVEAEKKTSVKETLLSLLKNKYWKIFIGMHFFMWGGLFLETGVMVYYFKYNLGSEELSTVAATIFSLVPVVGNFLVPVLARKMSKKAIMQIGSLGRVVGMVIVFFAGNSVPVVLAGMVVTSVARGLMSTIYWAIQADPIDYGEYETGISASGTICAVNGFCGKLWMALAGSLSAAVLGAAGYVGSADIQTASALAAIKIMYIVVPSVFLIGVVVVMHFYDLDEKMPSIMKELENRRNASHE